MTTDTSADAPARPTLEGASWHGATLVIDDPAALKKIRRREISPSTASNIRKCEASFAAESILPKPNNPFEPRMIGTGAHEAMEHLFRRDPSDRTTDFIHEEVRRIGSVIWSPEMLTDEERRRVLMPDADEEFLVSADVTDQLVEANVRATERWLGIVEPWSLGIFHMSGQPHPRDVEVYGTELAVGGWDFDAGKPNEVTLNLQGLRGEFPVQGKIDRTDWVTLEDGRRGLSVRDFKFPQSKPRPPRRDGDDYAEQQRIYTLFFKALHPELPVVDAALLYPGWDHVRNIDISEDALHGTLRMFEKAWLDMNKAADSHEFATKPSNLCGWCPLANACPVARISTEKAATEAGTKASGTELGITVTTETPRVTAWAQNGDFSRLPRTLKADVAAPESAAHRDRRNHYEASPASAVQAHDQEENVMTTATATAPAQAATAPAPVPSPSFHYPTDNYGPMAVFGLVDAAARQLDEAQQKVSPTAISALSRVLGDITLGVSQRLYGNRGWAHGSVGRVAFAVKSSILMRPAPFGQDEKAWGDWKSLIEALTTAKVTASQSLLDNPDADSSAALGYLAANSTVTV